MHWACMADKPNIVRLLLEKDTEDILGNPGSLASEKIQNGATALSMAIGNRHRFVKSQNTRIILSSKWIR